MEPITIILQIKKNTQEVESIISRDPYLRDWVFEENGNIWRSEEHTFSDLEHLEDALLEVGEDVEIFIEK